MISPLTSCRRRASPRERPVNLWIRTDSRSRTLPTAGSDRSLTPGERSEEHTSELQSQSNLVCRLLLEKKKMRTKQHTSELQSQSNPVSPLLLQKHTTSQPLTPHRASMT